MVDAVVSLEQAGHRGPIEVFSGTACCPMCAGNRRPGKIFWCRPQHSQPSAVAARTASALPDRSPRASIGRRRWTRCAHIGRLWSQASEREKRQFVRHVRPWWESHHHRSPPLSAQLVARLHEEGRLRIRAASFKGLEPGGEV
jgi:uncharacterized NAD(P)/FAD-binding protein YdhS